jgi:hypothetical protein
MLQIRYRPELSCRSPKAGTVGFDVMSLDPSDDPRKK